MADKSDSNFSGTAKQETRDISYDPSARALANSNMGASSAIASRAKHAPTQEVRDLERFNIERIKAEVLLRAEQKRAEKNDAPPDNQMLPYQVIKNARGEVLMQGHAKTVEDLITTKLDEAADKGEKVNLAGAQLDEKALGRRLQLNGVLFNKADLRGANLGGATVKDCMFEGCEMEGAMLKKTHFSHCAIGDSNMSSFKGDAHTKFSDCALDNVNMAHANAPEIKFENIHADQLNISEAHFEGSSWTHIHLKDFQARNAYMNGSKLGDFHVMGKDSNMDGIKLNGASVYNATFGTPDYGISMRGLEAKNSTWDEVQFHGSDLTDADFTVVTNPALMPSLRAVRVSPSAPQPNSKRKGN